VTRLEAYRALLALPDEDGLSRRYTYTVPGARNRDAVKRKLALAWLAHRLQDAAPECAIVSVRRFPLHLVKRAR
jgi:hypothetical protein